MKFSKISLFIFLASVLFCENSFGMEQLSTEEKLFEHARVGCIFTVKETDELENVKNWQYKKGTDVFIQTEQAVGYDKTKEETFLPQAHIVIGNGYSPLNQVRLLWDISGIQKYAIEQYKKNARLWVQYKDGGSWFEKHSIVFGTFIGISAFTAGWFGKTWWNSHQ